MAERKHDIVLFGATGFTGRLVAAYLLEAAPASVRWALAGRSERKLEAVRSDLAERFVGAAELPTLVADAHDRAALDEVAASTRVVCTTVGPYSEHGEALVGACAAQGTHYCDLTGETPFIRRMIDAHHARALETGARIVHCCGFDSIPSDLGCLMVAEALRERGARPKRVRFYLGESKGGVSGGTAASLLHVLEAAGRDPDIRQGLRHPYGLDPEPKPRGPDGRDQVGIRFDSDLGSWTAPFVMAPINTRVVRRSHALRGHPYGDDFSYRETMSTGPGPRGLARALAITAGLGGFLAAAGVTPIRRALWDRLLPKPGEGPSKAERDAGFFTVRLLAEGVTESGETTRVRGVVRGEKDPGYGETAKMLGESALCLALDGDRLPSRGGDLTPASAMGAVLTERLRAAGMTFALED